MSTVEQGLYKEKKRAERLIALNEETGNETALHMWKLKLKYIKEAIKQLNEANL